MARRKKNRTQTNRWPLIIAAVAAVAALAVMFVQGNRTKPPEPRPDVRPARQEFPLSPVSPSRFKNTSAGEVVGNAACRKCHEDQHDSYLHTTHSRALALADPSLEPAGTEFHHELSGRSYRVYERDGKMRHREWVKDERGEDVVLSDFEINYVIGSGNHSRSYLFESDGFLMESPLTWFAATRKWGMSPGYESDPHQPGFSREARFTCVHCHSGGVEALNGSTHRLKIRHMAITCERCHGPGSLHVDFHEQGGAVDGEDLTIVNPAHLDRAGRDAVCSQCHLATVSLVDVRGRGRTTFRPGMATAEHLVAYRLDAPTQSMTVVGHVEQMRMSLCHSKSDSLTCITCHDPHRPLKEEEKIAYYRDRCLDCHGETDCGLEKETRLARDKQDNCAGCHMPTGDTEIPHFAFTHHRIGIHDKNPSEPGGRVINQFYELKPLDDVSHLTEIDRDRCLGLAYVEVSDQAVGKAAAVYRQRAIELLTKVRDRGLRDADVEAALARLFWRKDPQRTIDHARRALSIKNLTPAARRDALAVLTSTFYDLKQTAPAIAALRKRVLVQRSAEAWMLLCISLQRNGELNEALKAAQKAVEIEPFRPDLQQVLAELYARTNQAKLAQQHLQRAKLMQAAPAPTPR